MDYKTHFNFLLSYDLWANNVVISTLKDNNLTSGKPIELLSHILNGELLMMARIKKTDKIELWEKRSIDENNELLKTINGKWQEFINTSEEKDFNKRIEYINIFNENISPKIWEMFTHMINHGTYHRGQIASSIRSMNITPPVTDLMKFATINKK